jgi:hypothetical protein
MSPLKELTSTVKCEYPLGLRMERTLLNGEVVDLISTPEGGLIRREKPKPDEVLCPGDAVQLANGSTVIVFSREQQK